jgi:hypothetical protein
MFAICPSQPKKKKAAREVSTGRGRNWLIAIYYARKGLLPRSVDRDA